MISKLITRSDDFGSSNASNQAIYQSLKEKNYIKNVSCMAVGPMMEAGAELLKTLPTHDFSIGMHGTLTSEWTYLKWFPMTETSKIPSLVTDQNTFPPEFGLLGQRIEPDEVVKEFNAQLDQLTKLGLPISYFDTHMMPELFYPELIPVLNEWANQKGLINHLDWYELRQNLGPHSFSSEKTGFTLWTEWINGLTEDYRLTLMHPMLPSREGLSFANSRSAIGRVGKYRANEYKLLMSGKLDKWCDKNEIMRVSYEYAERNITKKGSEGTKNGRKRTG
ncbi:ChbG/HpnK family deacetylase [Enterococcus gilvus]|uniref:ChbG/HpnK family deacetylase n=1 Tax=Enterococcus gilvus TaxID=160453 RepID=UPI003D6BB7E0